MMFVGLPPQVFCEGNLQQWLCSEPGRKLVHLPPCPTKSQRHHSMERRQKRRIGGGRAAPLVVIGIPGRPLCQDQAACL